MGRVVHDGGSKSPKMSANAPSGRATDTAKYVQSFEEVAIMTEQPSPADPWVPRGNPKRDVHQDGLGVPGRLSAYDDRRNLRADPQTFFRDTPESVKSDKDARPDRLRTYRLQSGEVIP